MVVSFQLSLGLTTPGKVLSLFALESGIGGSIKVPLPATGPGLFQRPCHHSTCLCMYCDGSFQGSRFKVQGVCVLCMCVHAHTYTFVLTSTQAENNTDTYVCLQVNDA